LGTARKISSLAAYLAGDPDEETTPPFYVITIWDKGRKELTAAQQQALVDHELMHCEPQLDDGGNWKLVIRGHDLEEFNAIVERHGLWQPDVEAMAKAMEDAIQPGLPFGDLLRDRPERLKSVTVSVPGGPEADMYSPKALR
jgi:hypothetical protein